MIYTPPHRYKDAQISFVASANLLLDLGGVKV